MYGNGAVLPPLIIAQQWLRHKDSRQVTVTRDVSVTCYRSHSLLIAPGYHQIDAAQPACFHPGRLDSRWPSRRTGAQSGWRFPNGEPNLQSDGEQVFNFLNEKG